MWTLRRTSIRLSLRNQALNNNVGASHASCVKLIPNTLVENEDALPDSHQIIHARFLSTGQTFYRTGNAFQQFTLSRRELSSQADASNKKDDDDDDLEVEDQLTEHDADGDSVHSETDLSDGEEDGGKPQDELELSDAESDKKSKSGKSRSELFKAVVNVSGLSVDSALDKWVAKGKELSRKEISSTLLNLRKRRMYGKALQVLDWLESNKKLEFTDREYASKLDLIAKLRGLPSAEKYLEHVPQSFKGELLYRTLLANCASLNYLKKTEEIFNKMRELDFPITPFACNQLLLIYKRTDKKKIADVLLMMEKENIKPSPFTYKILIDVKGVSNDIDGMDQIVETMKAEGVEIDHQTQATLARHYASAGLTEKSEAILKEIEGENLKENLWVCPTLLRLYAILGRPDEVERIWKVCESKPRVEDCLAAVEAWGRLKRIEEAEAVFEMMSNKWKLSAKNYSALLKIYTRNKMLIKGKDLIKKMGDSGCVIGPLTWDALVSLYVQAGEVEKADSVLQKALQQKRMKPLFTTYMTVMEQYAKRGDVHNAEKIFHRMRQAGYTSRITPFHSLAQAYKNANMPAYGIRERMKADNLFPNRALSDQLAQVDPFRKTPVSDLLD
ncbi:pentatricopeptide repeat-containing protein At1g80270, mitochondrial-like [Vicia villosa]|uniref:pentatricopeptide repeat-containing protein At1g80270, mitochondrial-like n=1 Tax=Vicia villosa TaxID=3911 RepID=UPI00273AE0D5|nr:pentatricopeptide repeat-containing protein At1g80270, mitochondrial-like [Vicia villosa]